MNLDTSDIVIRGQSERRYLFLDGAEFLKLELAGSAGEVCTNLVSGQKVKVGVWDRFAIRCVKDEADYFGGYDPADVNLSLSRSAQNALMAALRAERERKRAVQAAAERAKQRVADAKIRAERERIYREEEAANRKREEELYGLNWDGTIKYPNSNDW